jgi:DNA-binding PadR family transcriptional regulator
MRAETLKGHLDFLLLAIVAAEPAHGYAIIEELKRRSGGAFDLPEGTVYPALHRLEQSGLLTSAWDAGSARRRRVYRITARGRRALAGERRAWDGFTRAVEGVVA